MLTPGLSAAEKAMFSRDGFAFCLLGQTRLRGINASEIRLEVLRLPGQGRGPVTAYLTSSPGSQLQHPGMIEVQPLRTETQAQNSLSIAVQPAEQLTWDLWLWVLVAHSQAAEAGQPMQSYMVRHTKPVPANLRADSKPRKTDLQFTDQPLSRNGLHQRLKQHLQSISASGGESMHSFKRGVAQQEESLGHEDIAIMDKLLMQTRSVLKGNYLASGRHESGVTRIRSSAAQATSSRPAKRLACQQVGPFNLCWSCLSWASCCM